MSKTAMKRLKTEYQMLVENPSEEFTVGPMEEDNFFVWRAIIRGPPGSLYEGGVFAAKLVFPESYPMTAPSMHFCCDMKHPNITRDGRICMEMLQIPDTSGLQWALYENPKNQWTPTRDVKEIILSVISLLSKPDFRIAANLSAYELWNSGHGVEDKIQAIVNKHRGPLHL